jgi:hypothetical protein
MEGKHPGPSDVAVLTLGSQDVAQSIWEATGQGQGQFQSNAKICNDVIDLFDNVLEPQS